MTSQSSCVFLRNCALLADITSVTHAQIDTSNVDVLMTNSYENGGVAGQSVVPMKWVWLLGLVFTSCTVDVCTMSVRYIHARIRHL